MKNIVLPRFRVSNVNIFFNLYIKLKPLISSLLWSLDHENISFCSKVIHINILKNTCPGFTSPGFKPSHGFHPIGKPRASPFLFLDEGTESSEVATSGISPYQKLSKMRSEHFANLFLQSDVRFHLLLCTFNNMASKI